MADFFVSYASPDEDWAEWICWTLEAAGYTTINQSWDFKAGANFVLEMQKATTSVERVIAVISPEYLESAYAQTEWAVGFALNPAGRDPRLIPIKVGDCELEGILAQVVSIDLVGLSEENATRALLTGVQRERGKPHKPPAYPKSVGKARRVCFPGSDVRRSTLDPRRLVHRRISGKKILDLESIQNPYFESSDPTDYAGLVKPLGVSVFLWLPNTQQLRHSPGGRYQPVCAVCVTNPFHSLEVLGKALDPGVLGRLDRLPSKIRNQDKERLFLAIADAFADGFLVTVTIPNLAMAASRRKPEVGYQMIVDLVDLPLIAMHRRLDFERIRIFMPNVGKKSPDLIRLVKRASKAFFPAKGSRISLVAGDDEFSTLCGVARLIAWSVARAHNFGKTEWITLLEKALGQ